MSEIETFRREVSVELSEEGDGRTLVSRLVPYNEIATVSDDGMTTYQEEFLPGAFEAQMRAAHRVKVFLNYRHGQSLQDQIGHAASLQDEADGLYGQLRVLEHPDGDKALALVHAGVLDRLSIEFRALKSRVRDGVRQRVRAQLVGVALAPEGAYASAAVLAVRESPADEDGDDDEPEPVPAMSSDLLERLERFVEVPVALGHFRAFTEQAWDGSPGRWPDAASYCRSALIDDNPAGAEKSKSLCHLPIREPNGDINVNAVRNALARVDQVQTSDQKKSRARARLEALLAQFNSSGS